MSTVLADSIFEHDKHFGDLINMIAADLYDEDREAHPIEQNKYYKHKKIPLKLHEKKAMRKVRLNKAYGTAEVDDNEGNVESGNQNDSDDDNVMDIDANSHDKSKQENDEHDGFHNANSVDISSSNEGNTSSMDMLRKRLHDKIQKLQNQRMGKGRKKNNNNTNSNKGLAISMSKRKVCVCGYEGRSDNYKRHMQQCKAASIIEQLQEEVKRLKTENEVLQKMSGNVQNITNNNITNNVTNNIVIYGNESLPNALEEIRELCKKGQLENVVPRYIEMKHFTEGSGNIRMQGDRLEVFNENGWVNIDKNRELNRLTVDNAEELLERYGKMTVVSFFKNWYDRLDMSKNKNTKEYKEVREIVEDMIRMNSE